MLRRLLLRIPRVARIAGAAAAAAGGWVVSQVSDLTGWSLVGFTALYVLFAALAIGIPELQQWQLQQASRLNLQLVAHLGGRSELWLPAYGDADGVIDHRVEAERRASLQPLLRARARAAPAGGGKSRTFDVDALRKQDRGASNPLAGVKMRDLRRLEERHAAGEELTEREQEILSAHTALRPAPPQRHSDCRQRG